MEKQKKAQKKQMATIEQSQIGTTSTTPSDIVERKPISFFNPNVDSVVWANFVKKRMKFWYDTKFGREYLALTEKEELEFLKNAHNYDSIRTNLKTNYQENWVVINGDEIAIFCKKQQGLTFSFVNSFFLVKKSHDYSP